MQFPKGRVDSLTSHLLRKCPNVTEEDRQWVFEQMQQNPERKSSKANTPVKGLPAHIQQEDLQSEIPMGVYQQPQPPSALDTLAEVSRRHLDYSSQRAVDGQALKQRAKTVGEVIAEQALIAELQQQSILSSSLSTAGSTSLYSLPVDASSQQQQSAEISLMTTTDMSAPPLVQAASAANQQLERSQAQNGQQKRSTSHVDPQLHNMGGAIQSQFNNDTANRQEDESDTMTWNPTTIPVPQHTFGSLSVPSNEPTLGFGLLQKSQKNKTRGRFNDSRRKEVQEIRKRGACIRCRMLKKPCSEETPCNTCKNVESARLWKATCLRMRLADAFTLWSVNLFDSRAKVEIPSAVQDLEQLSLLGRLEARFFTRSNSCLSFSAKAYRESSTGADLTLHNESGLEMNESKNVWLLDEGEVMTDKIEQYVNQLADASIEEEPSPLLRATLQRSQELVRAEEAEQAAKAAEAPEQPPPRSCYNLQNQLLKNVVELWVLTGLLTTPERHNLQLRHNPLKAARIQPENIDWEAEDWEAEDGESSCRIIPESSFSHRLIQSQLAVAIESRCSKLSKTVMNELERRLLQRQQVSRFATFLSAVILLNCVERMTGLYRSLDSDELPKEAHEPRTEVNARSVDAAWGNMSYRIAEQSSLWPLDIPPSSLWPQGPLFAELLTMLLRMRALPPKTSQNQDGTLAAMQDYALPVHVNGRPVREQLDEQTKSAAAWLDPLKLSVAMLVEKRDGQLPGKDGPVGSWDLIFVAKVLLPERLR